MLSEIRIAFQARVHVIANDFIFKTQILIVKTRLSTFSWNSLFERTLAEYLISL